MAREIVYTLGGGFVRAARKAVLIQMELCLRAEPESRTYRGRERRELSSFIDISPLVNPFTNLPPEPADPPNMPTMSLSSAG
jgi:hypothetical protein